MSLIQLIGERKDKGQTKEFPYYQCERYEDVEELVRVIGKDLFMEALNAGLATIGRKKVRSNNDPRLTAGQMQNIRRWRDLLALDAVDIELAVQSLVSSGIDEEVAREHLTQKEEE